MHEETDHQRLLARAAIKTAKIGIVGMGYVGQPLALRFSEVGFDVVGFDVDAERVDQLNRGQTTIEHIGNQRIADANARGMRCTATFEEAADMDAMILCVPTPLNSYREPDLQYVQQSCEAIALHITPGTLISLESTTYPGTTEEEIVPRLEANGLKVGQDIFVVYSPEREDPGNSRYSTSTIPKLIAGCTPNCLEAGKAIYGQSIEKLVSLRSTRQAEMAKLLENIHRAVNIGLVNEMKIVADRMGINIFEVIDAAATKPFGFTAYYPGPGLGGHCIPIDPFYLTWKAREYGLHTRFIELAGEVNQAMPAYVFSKLSSALNEREKPVKNSKILVLGIAYKKNIDDVRESPSVALMELIRDAGGLVMYSDPHVPVFPKMRDHAFDLASEDLSPELLQNTDAVIVATDHDWFNYQTILDHADLIIDSRGAYRYFEDAAVNRVVLA